MVVGGVFHALFQAHHLSGLVHHVHQDVGGQTLAHVVDPLEQIAIAQGGHTDGGILIIDLVIVVGHLELGDHVGQLAQLAAAQTLGRVFVQHGHLVKGDFRHIGSKIAVFDGQQLGIGLAAEHHAAQQGAHQQNGDEGGAGHQGPFAALPNGAEHLVGFLTLGDGEAAGDQGQHAEHRHAQKEEGVEVLVVEIDGRQGHIKIHGGKGGRQQQAQRQLAFAHHGGFFLGNIGHRRSSFFR